MQQQNVDFVGLIILEDSATRMARVVIIVKNFTTLNLSVRVKNVIRELNQM